MKQRCFLISLITLLLCSCDKDNKISDSQEIVFKSCRYSFANADRHYKMAEINISDKTEPSIVIYLHGGSSRGNDNEKQMQEPAVGVIAQYLQQKGISAIFIIPQCPKTDSQGNDMAWNKMSKAIEYLIKSEQRTTSTPVYIFGGSMGGTGVWNMLSSYPGLFTAAMSCAGNPKGCNAENIAQTPIYAVMGSEDKVMKIEEINLQVFLDEVKSVGGEYIYDIEDGWNHEKICTDSYITRRLDWVFSH